MAASGLTAWFVSTGIALPPSISSRTTKNATHPIKGTRGVIKRFRGATQIQTSRLCCMQLIPHCRIRSIARLRLHHILSSVTGDIPRTFALCSQAHSTTAWYRFTPAPALCNLDRSYTLPVRCFILFTCACEKYTGVLVVCQAFFAKTLLTKTHLSVKITLLSKGAVL